MSILGQENKLEELKHLLDSSPGSEKVILYYEEKRTKQELNKTISGSDEVLEHLNALFGAENVKKVKK